MDAQHSGRSPTPGPRTGRLLRTFDTASAEVATSEPGYPRPDIQGAPAIGADGTIYIGDFPGTLFALRDGPGDQLQVAWRFHPPRWTSMHATPALGRDGTVYLGFINNWTAPATSRATLYALQAPTSRLAVRHAVAQGVWAVDLEHGPRLSSPTVGPDGTIYIVNGVGKLFAVAPEGRVKWTAATGPVLVATPALGPDGTVYSSSTDGKLYAVGSSR